LAAAAGVSQSMIAQVEGGDRVPSMETLHVLARALGVAPGYLVGASVADMSADYALDPRAAVLADYESPPGLRDLAEDALLCEVLKVEPDEWATLRSLKVDLPPSKHGYLTLLHVLRAVCPR